MARFVDRRFYAARRRVYGGLAVFAVAAFVSMALVPAWRARLTGRLAQLAAAVRGDMPAVALNVGENEEPFPAELERPSRAAPPLAQGADAREIFSIAPAPRPSPPPRPRTAPAPERRTTLSPAPVLIDDAAERAASGGAAPAEGEPRYAAGAMEREAYDLVLKSHPAAAALAAGSDPGLRFLSWGAAPRGNDLYWVRLSFQSEDGEEMEYIWQVSLGEKKAVPLNYNARSLP